LPAPRLLKPDAKTFQGLFELIKFYSDRKEMLPKTLDELYRQVRGFRILINEPDDIAETVQVIGSAHLDIFTPILGEIKSLAVAEAFIAKGYGRLLVEDCEREAYELGLKKLFVLTYKQSFFERLGYHVVDIKTLPEKVFQECVKCHFYNSCNEIAMVKEL
jgi:amino-acid N-acetyltransferase